MRSIARELGTGPASLYAHVAGRDELDSLIVARVASRLDVPDPDPDRWQEQLRELMFAMLRLYDENPGVARASLGLVPLSPSMLGGLERIVALLRAGDVPDQVIAWFVDMMALVVGAVALERDIFRNRPVVSEDPAAYFDQVHESLTRIPADQYPVLASLAGALGAGDGDDRFGFAVDLMIAGLAAFTSGAVRIRPPGGPGGARSAPVDG